MPSVKVRQPNEYLRSPSRTFLGSAVASDTVNIPNGPALAIAVAVAGDIKITDMEDNDVVIPSGALAAGGQHSLQIKRLWSTGTTATGIVLFG